MIRPVFLADTESIVALTEATGVFRPLELVALREVLDDYHATNQSLGHIAVADELDGVIRGYAYFAPAAMTDRTWYLWWIAVRPNLQGKGVGGQLLKHAEEQVRTQSGRMLLAETSSTERYAPTRAFYLRHGYELIATLPDFYADGDSMTVFAKRWC